MFYIQLSDPEAFRSDDAVEWRPHFPEKEVHGYVRGVVNANQGNFEVVITVKEVLEWNLRNPAPPQVGSRVLCKQHELYLVCPDTALEAVLATVRAAQNSSGC